ncbi:unnamed protein product (macronuclear) [Paramecium tetraurelia]|uniref:Uncharacterized protein n=1 Tax=Paramecium tetraurelia TaxID=5888 RepID=A0C744_PARTE|nr:uncharacterized protein GSPATT00035741001 [Paramecium tetraurelia]CAK66611.1 unnamed protein product [Paramecium tetraurelia]|eukprot:XP_001434008.1 hypothetical protein (macronuclear) [Paramecium tetraurelia strain d4-2]
MKSHKQQYSLKITENPDLWFISNPVKMSTEEQKRCRFSKFTNFVQNRDELLVYLKQFQYFVTVDALYIGMSNNFYQSTDLIIEAIMTQLRPKVFVALTYNNEELAEIYLNKLETQLEYIHLHLETLCENELAKRTQLGKEMGAFLNSGKQYHLKCKQIVKILLYQDPKQNKFVLTSLQRNTKNLEFLKINYIQLQKERDTFEQIRQEKKDYQNKSSPEPQMKQRLLKRVQDKKIKVLYAITEQQLNSEISDPEWILQKPEVSPPKQEGDGGDKEPKEGRNADGEESAPKLISIIFNGQRMKLLNIWLKYL